MYILGANMSISGALYISGANTF